MLRHMDSDGGSASATPLMPLSASMDGFVHKYGVLEMSFTNVGTNMADEDVGLAECRLTSFVGASPMHSASTRSDGQANL
jgi:hypothetical protein